MMEVNRHKRGGHEIPNVRKLEKQKVTSKHGEDFKKRGASPFEKTKIEKTKRLHQVYRAKFG